MFANRPLGLLFLIQTISKQLLPIVVVFLLQNLQPTLLQAGYRWSLAYILALPLTLLAKQAHWKIRREMDMRRLRGQNLPEVPYSMPLGIDLISKSLRSFTEDYMGTLLSSIRQLVS